MIILNLYHRCTDNIDLSTLLHGIAKLPTNFESDYVQVASFKGTSGASSIEEHLEEVFLKTQNEDSNWSEDGHRSTPLSDIIKVEQSSTVTYYGVVPSGFNLLENYNV